MVFRSEFVIAFLNVITEYLHCGVEKISVDSLNALSFFFWFKGNFMPFQKIPLSFASLSKCFEDIRNFFPLKKCNKR